MPDQVCHCRGMRLVDFCLYLNPDDWAQLNSLLTDRHTPRKLVWRAEIVQETADGLGTNEVMRRARTSKPTVWRWRERYLDGGVAGLGRDKTRPSRVPRPHRHCRWARRLGLLGQADGNARSILGLRQCGDDGDRQAGRRHWL